MGTYVHLPSLIEIVFLQTFQQYAEEYMTIKSGLVLYMY